jgi:fatty-acyl-CoA synthase
LIEAMFACFRIGAVVVPTNFRQTPDEIAYLAASSGAIGFCCGAEFLPHHDAARAASADLRFLVTLDTDDCPAPGAVGFEALVAAHAGRAAPVAAVEHDDPCWLLFTSGTTEADSSIILGPLSHGAGVHQMLQIAKGVRSVMPVGDGLDPDAVWALIEQWRVTNLFTVPTILKMLVEHPAVDRHDHSSLRHVVYAGSPMYQEDQQFALRKLGQVLVQYYGLGEVTGAISILPAHLHDGRKPQSAGYVRTGMEVQIQDENGSPVAPGETGEICVIGPAVCAGYYNDAAANDRAFRDGWFRTGDLGHVDEDGYLFITGRASDMYISGGSNIYPREIEEKILQHAAIREVAVIGVPDRKWGEVGIAVCVLAADGAAIEESELADWLDAKIARYKKPKRFLFWPELPKSAYGKVLKRDIFKTLTSDTPTMENSVDGR